jgi:hypothetical protein
MQMYPAYKLQDVLSEYAITFFALLNQGYRLRYKNYLMLAGISDLPQADKSHREQFYRNLEWAATDPSDILSSSGKGSTDAEIKKALGG